MTLESLPVLFLDCQTTATQPSAGEVIELGWARYSAVEIAEQGADHCQIRARLLTPPPDCLVSRTVQRITGLRAEDLATAAAPEAVWRELLGELPPAAVPTVIHYARFEKPFLSVLHERHGAGALPFDIACSYQIAKKLIPGLPSSTLRAVSGHFGRVLGEAHRSTDHVRATLWIWQHLVRQLRDLGITEWDALQKWLAVKTARNGKTKRHYLLPREKRLALPARPGVYRMLSRDGKLLYVGKASSLRDRVNSYFRSRAATRSRLPELMAQVHDIDVTPLETSVEAALLETDEIKRWNPPYNAALRSRGTQLTYWSRDFTRFQLAPDDEHPQGPFPGHQTMGQLSALGDLLASGEDPYGVLLHIEDAEAIRGGATLFRERYHLLADAALSPPALLNLGSRLPPSPDEAGPDDENTEPVYTAGDAARSLENILRRTADTARRARWLCRLTDASLSWRHGQAGERRLLHFIDGKWSGGETLPAGGETPSPPHWQKNRGARQACFDLTTYDRLAVLLAEIRRLVGERREVELRLAPGVRFAQVELERRLG